MIYKGNLPPAFILSITLSPSMSRKKTAEVSEKNPEKNGWMKPDGLPFTNQDAGKGVGNQQEIIVSFIQGFIENEGCITVTTFLIVKHKGSILLPMFTLLYQSSDLILKNANFQLKTCISKHYFSFSITPQKQCSPFFIADTAFFLFLKKMLLILIGG